MKNSKILKAKSPKNHKMSKNPNKAPRKKTKRFICMLQLHFFCILPRYTTKPSKVKWRLQMYCIAFLIPRIHNSIHLRGARWSSAEEIRQTQKKKTLHETGKKHL